ncbi:MAG: hypothetical protein IJ558_04795 [Treponema sp.]|nr:hypothetical protein [Treponema sp.]
MLAGTMDGESWGFYFDDAKDKLKKYIEITREEHTALMDGQAHGKVITFHEDKKPTLEDPPPPTEAEIAEQKIRELKNYLSETDYAAIKIAEGAADAGDYAEVLAKRKAAREEINEQEAVVQNSRESNYTE